MLTSILFIINTGVFMGIDVRKVSNIRTRYFSLFGCTAGVDIDIYIYLSRLTWACMYEFLFRCEY